MKKKHVLLTVFAAMLCCTIIFAACGIKTTVTELTGISINTDNVKVEYAPGEEFNADGLIVTASMKYANKLEESYVTLKAGEYTVDSSAYNKGVLGEYEIIVSYTFDKVTKTASFTVKVAGGRYDGLSVSLQEGVSDTYHLTAEGYTLDTSKVVVRQPDAMGVLESTPVTGYKTELYLGKEEVVLSNGVAVLTKAGAYQIWVSKESEKFPGYIRKAFVTVYVLNDVKSLVWDEAAQGTVATQTEGKDEISSTWKFIVTYENGAEKHIDKTDKSLKLGTVDTSSVGEKTVEATYSETNVKGEETSASATVKYTVTSSAAPAQTKEAVLNANDLTAGEITEPYVVAGGITIMAGAKDDSHNVTVDSNKKTIDGISFTQRIKMNGAGSEEYRSIKLETEGKGTVRFFAISSSGSDATRTLALYNEAGEKLYETEGIPGDAPAIYEAEIPAAGTYYLYGAKAVNLYYVKLVYELPAQTTEVTNTYSFSYSALKEAMTEALGAEPADKTVLKQDYFTGENSFINISVNSGEIYRSSNSCFEIKKGSVSVTFEGTGTLAIRVASTGGSNKSRFGVKNEAGVVLEAASYGNAELVTEGSEAKTYEVTGTSAVTLTYDITEAGTYTIFSAYETTTRGGRITGIDMTDTVVVGGEVVEKVTDKYSFSFAVLKATLTELLGEEPADKVALKPEHFAGDNAFLTLVGGGKNDQYRSNAKSCFELKEGVLYVTFKGTGTLTIKAASTSGTNKSSIAVKNASGTMLVASNTDANVTAITEGDEAGSYEVTNTTPLTITYEITEPGTYAIVCLYGVNPRGVRIGGIDMTDTH